MKPIEDIFKMYGKDVYRFIYWLIKNKQVSEDLAQETFIKVLKYKNNFDSRKGNFKAWLFTIARNTTYDYIRAQKKNMAHEADADIEVITVNANESPDELARKSLEKQMLFKLLNKLESHEKEVVYLKYIQEYKVSEISNITGLSQSNVKVITHRSIKKLKALYQSYERTTNN